MLSAYPPECKVVDEFFIKSKSTETGKDAVPPNALLLRAELATLWRMLQMSGRRVGSRFQQL